MATPTQNHNETLFSINGRIVPESDAVIPVTDRGFLYGDGLFETLHAYGRTLFRLSHHLDRLQKAAAQLCFDPLPDIGILARWLGSAVDSAGFPEANVRITVTRGSGPRGPSLFTPVDGIAKAVQFDPMVVITVTRQGRPAKSRTTEGVGAIIASIRRQESAATTSLKTLNYIEQILARREADLAGADEALLLNNAGLLCEGSASNIALIRSGVLTMPDPVRVGALPGIAQLTAVDAARRLGIPVAWTMLSPWDPGTSEEAFLSGSMREITPLVRVGETIVGTGKPGPITLKLIQEYRRIVERECPPFTFEERV